MTVSNRKCWKCEVFQWYHATAKEIRDDMICCVQMLDVLFVLQEVSAMVNLEGTFFGRGCG